MRAYSITWLLSGLFLVSVSSISHAIPVRYSFTSDLAAPSGGFLEGFLEFDDSLQTDTHVFSPTDIDNFEITFGTDASWSTAAGDMFGTSTLAENFFSLNAALAVDSFHFCFNSNGGCFLDVTGGTTTFGRGGAIPVGFISSISTIGGAWVTLPGPIGTPDFVSFNDPVFDGGVIQEPPNGSGPPRDVPEPATGMILASGLLAMGILRRNRHRLPKCVTR